MSVYDEHHREPSPYENRRLWGPSRVKRGRKLTLPEQHALGGFIRDHEWHFLVFDTLPNGFCIACGSLFTDVRDRAEQSCRPVRLY